MKKNKIETKRRFILLTFKPFLQITRTKLQLLTMKKDVLQEDDQRKWNLDCSGQGECQPNVYPSDGDEKMDFYNDFMARQKIKKDSLKKKKKESFK